MIGYAHLGGPIAGFGLVLVLLGTTRRDRLAGLGFAAIGSCVLAAALAPDKPGEIVGGTLGALVVGAALAWIFRRLPWLMPVAALACIPIRIGALGHQLLLPLYVVVIGAAIGLCWDLVQSELRIRELGPLAWPLAAYIGWTSLSLGWTLDVRAGAIEVLAFYIPFTVLTLAVARLPWSGLGLRALYAELTAMAVVFAAVGFYQYRTRNIFENPKVITSNAYAAFFRVNSVFWDPSVYGRFLVVAMIPSVVFVVRARSRRLQWAAVGVLVISWLGLLISFSQSSFAALLVGVTGAAFLVWRWRALAAVALAVLVLAGLAAAEPQVRRSITHHTSSGLNSATSGRANLVANGIRIAAHHPALGVGVGGFQRAYAARVKRLHGKKNLKTAASHDTPVTVAAETGLVGLVFFAWMLWALFRQAFRSRRTVSIASGLALAAILCHSLFYADFFEDPTTWLLIGLVAFARNRSATVRVEQAAPEERELVPA